MKCTEGVYTIKILKILTPEKLLLSLLNLKWLYHRVMRPKDADGMVNSVNTDQTAPLRAF